MRLEGLSALDVVTVVYSIFYPGRSIVSSIGPSGGCDYDYQIVNGMEASKVTNAIDSCPQAVKDWALYAYTPQANDSQMARLLPLIIDHLEKEIKIRVYRSEPISHSIRIIGVVDAILQDKRYGAGDVRGCDRLCQIADVTPAQFTGNKWWANLKRNVDNYLDKLDVAIEDVVYEALEPAEKIDG